MIEKKLITKDNLDFALKIQKTIFPDFDASSNYLSSINDNKTLKYYLLYHNNICIGISGFYKSDEDNNSGWLGWFGILPEYRRKHFGTSALQLYFDECLENGCSHARLYTDLYDNYATIQFYLKNGMIAEIYDNPDDNTHGIGVLVFSKLLDKSEHFELWQSKNLHLNQQLEKQKINK